MSLGDIFGNFFSPKTTTQGTTASQQQGQQAGSSFGTTNQNSFGTNDVNTTQATSGLTDVTGKGTPYLEAGLGNVLGQLGTFGSSPFQTAAGYNLAGLGSGASLGTAFGTANNVAGAGIGDPSRYMSPYLSSVVSPTLQAFNTQNQQALQNIRGNQASRGALGNNTGNRAEAVYYQGALPQQQAAIANLYNQGWNQSGQLSAQDAQTRLAGATAAGSLTGTLGGINTGLGGVGQASALTPYQQAQAYGSTISGLATPLGQTVGTTGLTTGQTSGQTTNATTGNTSNQYAGTSSGSSTGQTDQTTVDQPSPFEIATTLAGLGIKAFASDERVKENIAPIGKSFDGQPIYRFNYLGSPQTQIGFMAQDVEKKHPHAVGEAGGIKTVDYDAATAPAARKGHFALGGMPGGLMSLPGMGGVMDIMKSKGVPAGGLLGLGDMGSAGGMPFANGGSASFADKVLHAHETLTKMRNGGRAGYDDGGWVTDLTMGSLSPTDAQSTVDTATGNESASKWGQFGDALGGAGKTGTKPQQPGTNPNSAMDALAKQQAGLSQFVNSINPLQYARGMGYALGGAPSWGPGPEDAPQFDNAPAPTSIGLGASTPFETTLARLGVGEESSTPVRSAPAVSPRPDPNSSFAPRRVLPEGGGIGGWLDRFGAGFSGEYQQSPLHDLGNAALAAGVPASQRMVQSIRDAQKDYMARTAADQHWATLSGKLPGGGATLAAQQAIGEVNGQPTVAARALEPHTIASQMKLKEFEYKTQKDLASLEQLRKTESDIDSAVMYGAITPDEAELRRQKARELYMRTRGQIQDVTKPPALPAVPAPGARFKMLPDGTMVPE